MKLSMKFTILLIVAVWLSLGNAHAISPNEYKRNLLFQGEGVDFAAGEVIVRFDEGIQEEQRYTMVDSLGAGILKQFRKGNFMVVIIPDSMSVREAVDRFEAMPGVKFAEPNYRVQADWEPNDYFWTQHHMWNLRVMRMPEAWDIDQTPPLYGGDPSIVVAIIDTGFAYLDYVDTTHYGDPAGSDTVTFARAPDYELTHIWENSGESANPSDGVDNDGNGYIDDVNGWNFVFDNPLPCDDAGHGTHVSMTVAESTNNNPGSVSNDLSGVGMAFNCTVMACKALWLDQGGFVDDVAEAIWYAADNGAHIINMSLGGFGSDIELEAIQHANQLGCIVVGSSGNDADTFTWTCEDTGIGYPARYAEVIGAGASASFKAGDPNFPTEQRAIYTEYGHGLELLAPAGDYRTGDLDGSGYEDVTWQQSLRAMKYPDLTQFKFQGWYGTSMAAPQISAAAALVLSHYLTLGQQLTPTEVRNILAYSAEDLYAADGRVGYDYESGFGRIDVAAALTETPLPKLVYKNFDVSELNGNGNYRLEAGESGNIVINFVSLFSDATNVRMTLSTTDSHVTVTTATITHGNAAANTILTNSAHPFVVTLNESTPEGYDAQFQIQFQCNETSPVTQTVTIRVYTPAILLVDDDSGAGKSDYEVPYINALDQIGLPYDFHRVKQIIDCDNSGDEILYPFESFTEDSRPAIETLRKYDAVIWYLGYTQQNRETLRALETLFASYLDQGGGLLFSSHEYLYKLYKPAQDADTTTLPGDSFPYRYFHIDYIEHDEFYNQVTGASGDAIGSGLNIVLNDVYSSYQNPKEYRWWPDDVRPLSDAATVLNSGPINLPNPDFPDLSDDSGDQLPQGACAVRYPADGVSAAYRVIFCPFPLEGMDTTAADPNNLKTFLQRSLQWLLNRSSTPSLTLHLNKTSFTANDPFLLTMTLSNPGAESLQVVEWVVLEVVGFFYFWDTWTQDIDNRPATLSPGYYQTETVLEFTWPQGNFGTLDNIHFYGAYTNTAMTDLIGDLSSVTFGFY